MDKFEIKIMINKQILLTNWNFMRFLRLGLGIMLAFQAIEMRDYLSGILAVFFFYQAATNTGCCGTNQCEVRPNNTKENS